jgi:membrane protein implicated in regulation of membrane protease activity
MPKSEREEAMGVFLLLLLVVLAATGALFAVLKIAFAVALGVFLAVIAVGAYAAWRFRRAWQRAMNAPNQRPQARVNPAAEAPRPVAGSSEVRVLRPDEPASGPSSSSSE